jgi:tRNA A-37 threonylcarbamoyl transferase component Bud32
MTEWIEQKVGPLRWLVQPGWEKRLFNAAGLRLEAWRADRQLHVLKQAFHRTIYRVDLPDEPIFIKYYPVADLRAFVRQRLRPAKARTEMLCALALAERGVPTIEPLAVGEGALGESYLISRALVGAERLDDFFHRHLDAPPRQSFGLRLELARRLGLFLAQLHDVGVSHSDLHAGNLLIHPVTLELHLIDLHAVSLHNPLDWPASLNNLVLLNRWMIGRTQRAERRRFLRVYVHARKTLPFDPETEHRRAEELELATRESASGFWRKRSRRCVQAGRHFYTLAGSGREAWATAEFPKDVLEVLLADPDRPFACPAAKLLKDGRSATVCEFELVLGGKRRRVIYKRCQASRPSEPWVHLVRATPAMRSWVHGHALLDRGLPTARPFAVIQRRRFGIVHESYLLAEKLPGVRDLRSHVADLARQPAPRRLLPLRKLIERLAVLARGLHDRGVSHRDFKATNVLVQTARDAPLSRAVHASFRTPPRLFLIDLEGVSCSSTVSRTRAVQNLARLHASFHDHPLLTRTERLRFLRSYLRWGLQGKSDWKTWWREIGDATVRKIEQNHRRGRVLT